MSHRRISRPRLALLAACGFAALAALSAPSAALAATKPAKKSCPTTGTTKAQNAFVRLYTKPKAGDADPVYACRFSDGKPFALDATKGPECELSGPKLSNNVTLAGDMIAFATTECEMFTAYDHLLVYNAKTRKQTRYVKNVADVFPPVTTDPGDGYDDVDEIVLKPNGAVAWLVRSGYQSKEEPDTFQVRLLTAGGQSQVLDTSRTIDPNSLSLSKSGRLYWVNGFTIKTGAL
jgi:hypothetical protein